MTNLLWKDFRLNRALIILGAAVLAGVHIVGAAIEIGNTWPAMPSAKVAADALTSYAHLAFSLTPFIAALLGGNAICCERAERSAHFLAYLPPTKIQILTSKLGVGCGALVAFWSVIFLLMRVVAPLINPQPVNFLYMVTDPAAAIAVCILTFGIGWLGSAWLEKPTFPVLSALASPFVLGFGMTTFALISGVSRFAVLEWTGVACWSLGAVAFAAGTGLYLRRVEP
jgi:ABC-type transport system involved in multi-copper enzyme maturation permease subunit